MRYSANESVSALCLACGNMTFDHRVSSKKRKPAWTDRILWRLQPKDTSQDEQGEKRMGADMRKAKQTEEDEEYPLKITQDLYTSNMEFSISDHKPVISVFTLEVRHTHTLFILLMLKVMF